MTRSLFPSALALLLTGTAPARAERSALSLELGGGLSVVNVRAPYADGAPSQLGTSWATSLGASFALSNHLELTGRLFWEPSQQFVHSGATVNSDAGPLTGSLSEHTQRFGALAGARAVFGYVWRFSIGAEIGWSDRMFSGIDHFDVSSGTARSYGLRLADTSQSTIAFAPGIGVQWTSDHYAIGLAPRLEILVGGASTWALVAPLTFAWSWYL